MHSSQDKAIRVLNKYDTYAGDESDAGVGSRRVGRLLYSYVFSLLRVDLKSVRNSSASFGSI
jgi:hypothetical protein